MPIKTSNSGPDKNPMKSNTEEPKKKKINVDPKQGKLFDKEPKKASTEKGPAGKIGKVMNEYEQGKLHSGSKSGPIVKSKKQAIAIAISEKLKAKK